PLTDRARARLRLRRGDVGRSRRRCVRPAGAGGSGTERPRRADHGLCRASEDRHYYVGAGICAAKSVIRSDRHAFGRAVPEPIGTGALARDVPHLAQTERTICARRHRSPAFRRAVGGTRIAPLRRPERVLLAGRIGTCPYFLVGLPAAAKDGWAVPLHRT